jgi:hypothetical protein
MTADSSLSQTLILSSFAQRASQDEVK